MTEYERTRMWRKGEKQDRTHEWLLMNFDSIFYVLFLISRFLVEKKVFALKLHLTYYFALLFNLHIFLNLFLLHAFHYYW